jgi:hypothetical protein
MMSAIAAKWILHFDNMVRSLRLRHAQSLSHPKLQQSQQRQPLSERLTVSAGGANGRTWWWRCWLCHGKRFSHPEQFQQSPIPLKPNPSPNKKAPNGAFFKSKIPNHNLLQSVVVFAKNLAEERFFVPGWARWGVGDFGADGVVDVGE